jgi:hypothetical protein
MDIALDYTVRFPMYDDPEELYWVEVEQKEWCCAKVDIAGATYKLQFYTPNHLAGNFEGAIGWGQPCYDLFDSVLVTKITKETVYAAIQYLVSVKFYNFILPNTDTTW